MLKMSWRRPSEEGIQEAQAPECQLMSNSCALAALATKKGTKQRFNYMTVKSIKCNVDNEYSSSPAMKSAPDCKRTERDKRKAKKREETAFVLD